MLFSRVKISSLLWLHNKSRLSQGMWYKVLLWLDCASDLSSFWKTATLGEGGFGEFTLV